MRFLAPPRDAVSAELIDHPVFAGLAEYRDLLLSDQWPSVPALNERLLPITHAATCKPLLLVEQESLADDQTHYESRIFQRGEIATRSENWHDLLNALIWKKFPAIKSALNARQVENIGQVGTRQRTREQDAMTQFDEAGAVVVLRDPALLALWDSHDWQGLFFQQRQAWRDGRISLSIFGHAVMEHALHPEILLVAKALVFLHEAEEIDGVTLDRLTADAIVRRRYLSDPQHLRPLPLSGIAGWRPVRQDEMFYRQTACFRPLRPGRSYPAPMDFGDFAADDWARLVAEARR
jgi:hypothetical protein